MLIFIMSSSPLFTAKTSDWEIVVTLLKGLHLFVGFIFTIQAVMPTAGIRTEPFSTGRIETLNADLFFKASDPRSRAITLD